MNVSESPAARPVPALHPDGLPMPRRLWAVVAIALSISMAVLDGAIANIALPTLSEELGVAPSASIWVVNAYQLVITISLLPLASLGEILGYHRIYRVGLVVFTIASAACALSDTLLTLTLWRVVQGLGASGVMAVNAALIRFTYPHSQLGRGIGVNALVVAVSSAIGPTVASAILAVANWPWLFAVNVPIGILALVIGWRSLPHSPLSKRRFDTASALLCAATFGLLVMALDGIAHGGAWLLLVVGDQELLLVVLRCSDVRLAGLGLFGSRLFGVGRLCLGNDLRRHIALRCGGRLDLELRVATLLVLGDLCFARQFLVGRFFGVAVLGVIQRIAIHPDPRGARTPSSHHRTSDAQRSRRLHPGRCAAA